ncbi:Hypothetical_protein [Hexamita inflata]|uniref:Hypothetical_protein n=1 Tax=Hexamita inflata TaxID=28002 RepID=A0ABP1HGW6_9EUKA
MQQLQTAQIEFNKHNNDNIQCIKIKTEPNSQNYQEYSQVLTNEQTIYSEEIVQIIQSINSNLPSNNNQKTRYQVSDQLFFQEFGEYFYQQIRKQLGVIFQYQINNLKTALISRKQYVGQGNRLYIDFKPIMEKYQIGREKECHEYVERLNEIHLDKWSETEKMEVRQRIGQLWNNVNEGDIKIKKKTVTQLVTKELNLDTQFNKDFAQISNLISYQLNKLSKNNQTE